MKLNYENSFEIKCCAFVDYSASVQLVKVKFVRIVHLNCFENHLQVIMATNRIETLDPALIRPGRIDRKIEFPLPDEKTKRRIFAIHTNRMTVADDVNLEDYVMAKDDLSGADIKVWGVVLHCLVLQFSL